jgi:YggT family protein
MFTSLVVALTGGLIIAIIAQAILSWLPGVRALRPVSDVLQSVTGPILNPIRRRIPTFAGLDLSPWVAVLLLTFVQSLLVGALGGH